MPFDFCKGFYDGLFTRFGNAIIMRFHLHMDEGGDFPFMIPYHIGKFITLIRVVPDDKSMNLSYF